MSGQGNERRVAPRYEFRVPLRLRTRGATSGQRFAAETLNLSERGFCFIAERPLALGNRITVEMTVPQEITGHPPVEIEATARVVYVEDDIANGRRRIGACFEQIEPVAAGYGA